MERGWLTESAAAADSEAEAPAAKTEPTEQVSEITQMELSFPVEDWTVPQLKNFLHTLYSNQHILRRMMQSDALYIDRQMMERLDEAQTPADLEARLADGLATGLLNLSKILLCGFRNSYLIAHGRTLSNSPRISSKASWPAPESKSYLAIVGSQSDHVN